MLEKNNNHEYITLERASRATGRRWRATRAAMRWRRATRTTMRRRRTRTAMRRRRRRNHCLQIKYK